MWNLPGGGVEANESPWDAVIREVAEEVGLVARVERLLGVYSVPSRADLVLNFLCAAVGGAIRLSDEADAIEWFSRADIPPNTLARQRERIDDAFDHLQEPNLKTQV